MSQQHIEYLERRLRRVNAARNSAEIIVSVLLKHYRDPMVQDFHTFMKYVSWMEIPPYLSPGTSETYWKEYKRTYKRYMQEEPDATFEEWYDMQNIETHIP
jgi:hypothetical protein